MMARFETEDHRLALALIELAKEDKKIDEYMIALKGIQNDFVKEPKLLQIFSSYMIPIEESYKLVDKLYFSEELKHLSSFLKILIKKRYIRRFDAVLNEYVFEANKLLGVEEGIVYSARLLNDTEIDQLEKMFEEELKKKVHLLNRTEPSLIAGIRVFIGGKAYDGSLITKLENLKKELLKA